MSISTAVDLLRTRRTKIVATLGPASSSEEAIRGLIKAGVNVFRLNMSHGDHETHRSTYEKVRKISEELSKPIAILADLCGPKIRTGVFKEGQILLKTGEDVIVTTRDVVGSTGLIPSQYEALARDVKAGDRILLNDGVLELRVNSTEGTEIFCTVVHGGILKDKKGINLPGVNISAPSMTEKDYKDAVFSMELGVDFLALSFVRKAADIVELKTLIAATGKKTAVIAKIEKPEALMEISKIILVSDAIMVARGDLGVELNPEQIPVVQSELIQKAKGLFKPVIVATQMLESMIENARPSRAEVTDISNAVTLETDAVMLSAETAAGAYPIPSVEMMDRIIRQTESHLWAQGVYGSVSNKEKEGVAESVWDSISNATALLSQSLLAHAIIVISQSGMSVATISSSRPSAPVIGITGDPEVYRRMALLWSVLPVLRKDAGLAKPYDLAREVAKELDVAKTGEHILMMRGFHSDPLLNTPSVTVLTMT